MIRDETLKDNWVYQQMLAEGLEQGIERGIEQGIERGIEQGRIEEARQNIESFLERRFPMLLMGTKEQIERITDLGTLREFLLTVGMAQTADEVRQSLPTLD